MAIEQAAQEEQRPWRVRRVNLTEVLDPRGQFQRITGFAPEELYNLRLTRGWTLGLAQELKLLQARIRCAHPLPVARLVRHWQELLMQRAVRPSHLLITGFDPSPPAPH